MSTPINLRITWAEREPDPRDPKSFIVRYCLAAEDGVRLGVLLTPDNSRLAEILKREIKSKK